MVEVEDCDDGTDDGIGCMEGCQDGPADGWDCETIEDEINFSVCSPICGDDEIVGDEQCDVGLEEDIDGCDDFCR